MNISPSNHYASNKDKKLLNGFLFLLLSEKLKNSIMNVKTRRLRFIFNDNSFIFLQNKVAFPSPIVLWHQDAASFSKTEFCVNCFLGQKRSSTAIDRGQCPALPLFESHKQFPNCYWLRLVNWKIGLQFINHQQNLFVMWSTRTKKLLLLQSSSSFFPRTQYKNSFFFSKQHHRL